MVGARIRGRPDRRPTTHTERKADISNWATLTARIGTVPAFSHFATNTFGNRHVATDTNLAVISGKDVHNPAIQRVDSIHLHQGSECKVIE